jgi:hypothetical protein
MAQVNCPTVLDFTVKEWNATRVTYQTLADCATLELARAVFVAAIAKKPTGRFIIRSRTRIEQRHPEGDW